MNEVKRILERVREIEVGRESSWNTGAGERQFPQSLSHFINIGGLSNSGGTC